MAHQPFGRRERVLEVQIPPKAAISTFQSAKEGRNGFFGGQSLRLERSEANEGDIPRFPFELALGDLADSTGLRGNWCCIVTVEMSEK